MTPIARVADLAEQIRGVTYAKEDAESTPRRGYLPVLRAGNIADDGLVYDDLVYVPAERIGATQKLRRNDVLIATSSGSLDVVGKAARALADYEGGFGAFCKVLRPGPGIDPAYFAHFFRTRKYRQRVSTLAAGANINNLRNEHLDEFEIPVPPLPEQRRIAEILDKADALRAKRHAALLQLDTLTQSIFLDMFGDPATNPKGWPYFRLGDVAEFYAGSTLPEGDAFHGQADGYFLLKVSDMNLAGNEVYLVSCQQWSAQPGAVSSTCPAASIVIPKRGGAIGTNKKRIAVRPSVLDPNLMAMCPRQDLIELSFLYSWILRLDLASITSGSSVPQLNKRDLDPLSIPVPPLGLQRDFSHRFATMEKVGHLLGRARADGDSLFHSLQHRAFRGEL